MNCKPGEIALVLATEERFKEWRGRIVTTVALVTLPDLVQHHYWRIEEHPTIVFQDRILRPIGDPGPDAEDESLTWLPSPTERVLR